MLTPEQIKSLRSQGVPDELIAAMNGGESPPAVAPVQTRMQRPSMGVFKAPGRSQGGIARQPGPGQMASPEPFGKPIAAPAPPPNPYDTALTDPEYQLEVSEIDALLGDMKASYNADTTSLKGGYQEQRRKAEQRMPQDLRQSTERAAGRGMLYGGGILEEQGGIQKDFADGQANLARDENSELSRMLQQFTTNQGNSNRNRAQALQNAAGRATERAASRPIAPIAATAPVPPAGAGPVISGQPSAATGFSFRPAAGVFRRRR